MDIMMPSGRALAALAASSDMCTQCRRLLMSNMWAMRCDSPLRNDVESRISFPGKVLADGKSDDRSNNKNELLRRPFGVSPWLSQVLKPIRHDRLRIPRR